MSNDKKDKLIKAMEEAVLEMDDEEAVSLAEEYVEAGFDAMEGLTEGLAKGMNRAGELYEQKEYFIPELLLCSDAFYGAVDVLRPHIQKKTDSKEKMTAVIGVVEGDTHDIGKNILKIMLETEGFDVYDLGKDVPTESFISAAKEHKADFIGMSTLMTTTMIKMSEIIEELKDKGMRDQLVVMVGGGPISASYAEKIGADGYEPDAASAARRARELVLERRGGHAA
ncbi:MAG: corrinoid protein [Eubacterium sp.]|jgi:dimethylamine corrinoid protein|uniref:corrinoid protein n=1 Tax=Eubacterium sp. F2 TaxID=3381348 RepID=UPI0039084534|nr:corrinoid protein [Eubacterium sp.]MCI2197253.1 corrinoid protein [Eubacterium sp.]